jgi:hypothetical protein
LDTQLQLDEGLRVRPTFDGPALHLHSEESMSKEFKELARGEWETRRDPAAPAEKQEYEVSIFMEYCVNTIIALQALMPGKGIGERLLIDGKRWRGY